MLGVLRAVALPRERSGAIRGDEEMEPWIGKKKKLTAAVLGAVAAGPTQIGRASCRERV